MIRSVAAWQDAEIHPPHAPREGDEGRFTLLGMKIHLAGQDN